MAAINYFESISPEIMVNIFSYLGIKILAENQLVCRAWERVIRSNKRRLMYEKMENLYFYLYKDNYTGTLERKLFISAKPFTDKESLIVERSFYDCEKLSKLKRTFLVEEVPIYAIVIKSLKSVKEFHFINNRQEKAIDDVSYELFEIIFKMNKKHILNTNFINIIMSEKLYKFLTDYNMTIHPGTTCDFNCDNWLIKWEAERKRIWALIKFENGMWVAA